MTTKEKVTHWTKLSDYDLETAAVMLSTGRYLYVGFMCHQVIEKIFKAVYTKCKEDTPPYTHDIEYLAVKGGFYETLSEEQQDFIGVLNPLNIEARYPEYKKDISKILTPLKCDQLLKETTKLQLWTKEMLLSVK
ncbi:MAG: HEPN domain-containing protein [Lentimicrobiaceae bacterium]|nr:HEPN domain-containing protein [Lentimicrobiaceae bacterium]